MNDALISDLQSYADQPGVTIIDAAEHVDIRIQRPAFTVSIIIPKAVLELSITVYDDGGMSLIEDWLDYAGYDAAPETQLAEEMRAEVLTFVGRLLHRDLRLADRGRRLDWRAGDRWLQAVPFVPDIEPSRP